MQLFKTSTIPSRISSDQRFFQHHNKFLITHFSLYHLQTYLQLNLLYLHLTNKISDKVLSFPKATHPHPLLPLLWAHFNYPASLRIFNLFLLSKSIFLSAFKYVPFYPIKKEKERERERENIGPRLDWDQGGPGCKILKSTHSWGYANVSLASSSLRHAKTFFHSVLSVVNTLYLKSLSHIHTGSLHFFLLYSHFNI